MRVGWGMTAALATVLAVTAGAPGMAGAGEHKNAAAYLEEAYGKGEKMDYALAWLGVPGGRARLAIAPVDGARLQIDAIFQSNAFFSRIYPVRDNIESTVDRSTFSTIIFRKSLQEGRRHKEELTVIDPSRSVAIRKGVAIKVVAPVFDPLSIIYHLRKQDLTPGRSVPFNILGDGKTYTLQADVISTEIIRTEAGTFRTILVEPKMRGGGIFRDEDNRLFIWFSDDERRIPVRIRSEIPAGNITATLSAYSVGK